jgi:F0F1-type ATP synthase assembly protein I
VTIPPDDRSATAVAYEWAWRIIVVSLEMVLPGLFGYWIDTRLGTVCLFLTIGLIIGSVGGVRHLLQMVSKDSKSSRPK